MFLSLTILLSLWNVFLLFDNIERVEDRHRLTLDVNESEAGFGQQTGDTAVVRADGLLQILRLLRFIAEFGGCFQ